MKGEQQQRDKNYKKTKQIQELKNNIAQLRKFTGVLQDPG